MTLADLRALARQAEDLAAALRTAADGTPKPPRAGRPVRSDVRQRVLGELYRCPAALRELCAVLSDVPRTTVREHLHRLAREGRVRAVGERWEVVPR